MLVVIKKLIYQFSVYTGIPLQPTTGNTVETLCHDTFCCNFNITTTFNETTENYYQYRLVAYTGVRSFTGMYNGGIEICGIIFCQNASIIESCANRYINYTTISWPLTFERIEITANFTNVHTRQQYPNSLLSNIRPIYPNATIWSTIEHDDVVERKFVLIEPQRRLLTFAIYGRDFARDSDPATDVGSQLVSLCFVGTTVIAFVLWKL